MRQEPSLTFEGALRILGQHEHKTIKKIDKLLGGVILGGGAVAGAVALGVTPLAPLATFGVVWGWVEQKGLAVDLLTNAIDAVSGRLSGQRGHERRQLIAAAHSTIVVASIFEALRDHVGEEFYDKLKITDDEKIAAINKMERTWGEGSVTFLYGSAIPVPSGARGFQENVQRVAVWQERYASAVRGFLDGLAAAEYARIDWVDVRWRATERYVSRYFELAAKVPEFAIWAQLDEHAATRTTVREARDRVMGGVEALGSMLRERNADVMAALNANQDALNRIEALLSAGMNGTANGEEGAAGLRPGGLSALRQAVHWANTGILDEKIIRADRDRYPAGLEVPRVREIYINPRYRVAEYDAQARPTDEKWWETREPHDDFDLFLAGHVTSPDATRRPLLLLGHPGAGKSLLTKVFAARLPTSQYTVVRVPLRGVSAEAKIRRQIEEALEITHRQIEWHNLAEQSRDTVLVVLLDGLDELLQASGHRRSKYLEDVMDFQEEEARQQRSVVVVVTSRIVVADWVPVPDGTTIVKLDPFDDDDIADWLGRWKRVNADAIIAGTIGELTGNAARRQPGLAEQPLLLLMLALYAADPGLPPLDEEMATAELYRRLLDGFARREADKDLGLGHDPSPRELDQRMDDHLDRLAIAALGMFNRGQQDISEEELGKDLEALEPRLVERSPHAEPGRRIIGEFFFVHAPEAQTVAGRQGRYEFLHATFGEYLVARRVLEELVVVSVKAFSGRRGPTEPDDDLLFALLSHQVLAARRSMLDFAQQIFSGLGDTVRSQVLETIEVLAATYRNRHGSDRYAAYRPVLPDQVRQLACYSANLIALRVVLEPDPAGVPLLTLLRVPDPSPMRQHWKVTPLLWNSSLDTDGLVAMLTLIEAAGTPPRLRINKRDLRLIPFALSLARLIGDEATERRLRYGTAIGDEVTYYFDDRSWADMMRSWLIPAIAGINCVPQRLPAPPEGTPDEEIAEVANLIFKYLRSSSYSETNYRTVLQMLFKLPDVFKMDSLALTAAAIGRAGLREAVPELENFDLYGNYAEIVRRADGRFLTSKDQITHWKDPSDHVVYAIEDILRKPPRLQTGDRDLLMDG